MALGAFLAILVLIVVTVLGALMSFWARRSGIHGLEIWLPLAIILSYAISPLVGLIVVILILVGSFFLFPYPLHYLVIMIACVAGLCFSTLMFPVTAVSFVKTALYMTIVYNVVSNLIMFIIGHNVVHLFKFALMSTFFSWFIYLKLGWWFVMLFK
tara:strand:+ start:2132 stop:2599 length:468 start_codon:yes stop_codon:yes gene_type:complete